MPDGTLLLVNWRFTKGYFMGQNDQPGGIQMDGVIAAGSQRWRDNCPKITGDSPIQTFSSWICRLASHV